MNKFLRLFLGFLIALIVIITLQLGYLFYKKGNLSWSEYFSRQEPRYLVFKQDYPLIAAAQEGDINQVKALLEKGVDPNQSKFSVHSKPKELKGTESAAQILEEAIKIKLEPDSKEEKIAVRSEWPLRAAAGRNHPEIVRLLLEKGADVNLSDWNKETALTDAAYFASRAVIPLLIKAGADINVKNSMGDSPITIAARNGNDLVVQDLIAAGADVKNGSVLARAIDVYDIFLKNDEQREANKRAIQMLIDAGAPINDTSYEFTALSAASAAGRQDLVDLLLKAGANVNLKGKNGEAPLHAVASVTKFPALSPGKFKESHIQIAQQLINAGANINLQNENTKATPLILAVMHRNGEIAQILLQAGADKTIKDIHERTALDRAKKENFSDLVELLEKPVNEGTNV